MVGELLRVARNNGSPDEIDADILLNGAWEFPLPKQS